LCSFFACSLHHGQRNAHAQGHKCDIVYYDVMPNSRLEEYSKEYSRLLESHGEEPLSVRRLDNVEDVLKQSDVSPMVKLSAVCTDGKSCPLSDSVFGVPGQNFHEPFDVFDTAPAADMDTTCNDDSMSRAAHFPQVVSLHCALDEKTKHLINKERLGMMKEGAVLVNAARGPVIDEVALVEYLKANPNFRYTARHMRMTPHQDAVLVQ
jgi:D-isomer specific 2-hydroxyacid dehydrogenase, NAD binding domain